MEVSVSSPYQGEVLQKRHKTTVLEVDGVYRCYKCKIATAIAKLPVMINRVPEPSLMPLRLNKAPHRIHRCLYGHDHDCR